MHERVQLEISTWAILKVLLVLAAFYFLYLIRDIIVLFFIVLILAATFRPVVNRWERKIKRLPAVLALILIALAVLTFVVYILVPPLINQLQDFIKNLPEIMTRYSFLSSYRPLINNSLKSLTSNMSGLTGNFVNITASVFGGIFSFITALVMTIYLLLDRDGLKNFVISIIPADSQVPIINLAKKMSVKVGDWFRGQLILSSIIGLIYLIGLLIIGVPYALAIAVLAGIMEFVPVIGPIITGVIAALVALSISPIRALFVIVLFIVVQQLENTILVPKIMQKALGLSPIVIILALLIGAKILGLIGALLAVPLSALVSVVIQEWPAIRQSFRQNER